MRQNIGQRTVSGSQSPMYLLHRSDAQGAFGGLHAATIAAVAALIFYVFAAAFLFNTSWWDVALQALVQGVLRAVLSLLLYGRTVNILSASSGAAFAALCPTMTAIFAIPILGEWPTRPDWMASVIVSNRGLLRERRAVINAASAAQTGKLKCTSRQQPRFTPAHPPDSGQFFWPVQLRCCRRLRARLAWPV